jgi:hypothetical protein
VGKALLQTEVATPTSTSATVLASVCGIAAVAATVFVVRRRTKAAQERAPFEKLVTVDDEDAQFDDADVNTQLLA